jgi:hypothetical protein
LPQKAITVKSQWVTPEGAKQPLPAKGLPVENFYSAAVNFVYIPLYIPIHIPINCFPVALRGGVKSPMSV